MQLLDPVAMQQVYQLVEADPETLRRSFTISTTSSSIAYAEDKDPSELSAIDDPAKTPTENQVRYRDLMFGNVMQRAEEMQLGFYTATDGTRQAYGPQYHHSATFVARVLHPDSGTTMPLPTATDGTQEVNPVYDALNAATLRPSQEASGFMFRNLNDDQHPYLLSSKRDSLSDVFLMNTQWSPTDVLSVANRSFEGHDGLRANPWEMFEPPASLDATIARKKSCSKFRGNVGGRYSREFTRDDAPTNSDITEQSLEDVGPDGWGDACEHGRCRQMRITDGGTLLGDAQIQILGDSQHARLGDTYRSALLQTDDLGLTTMMTELTGGLFHPSTGGGEIVSNFVTLRTSQPDDCFFCMEYDDLDRPFTNGQCPHIDKDMLNPHSLEGSYETPCKSFAKTQQTVESQGVYDPTTVSCFASAHSNESIIEEEDYDPTIGCLSTAWSTTWPRDAEGEEIPQCCDDCEKGAVVLRDVAACFGNFDQCSAHMLEGIEDFFCDFLQKRVMNNIVTGMRNLNEMLVTMRQHGYGPGGFVQSVNACPQDFMGPDGKCTEAWKRLAAQGATVDATVYSYTTTTGVSGASSRLGPAPPPPSCGLGALGAGAGGGGAALAVGEYAAAEIGLGLAAPIPGAAVGALAIAAVDYYECKSQPPAARPNIPVAQTVTSQDHADQRDNLRNQGPQRTETTQISANQMINAAGTMGPNAPTVREVNYCNLCCDQSFNYCKKNNVPGGQCAGCNDAPFGTCQKMTLSPDLQNYVGYCASMHGGDDNKVCTDLTHLDTRLRHGTQAAFENGVTQTDLFRIHNARMQGSETPPHDYRYGAQGEQASFANSIEVASNNVAQREEVMTRMSSGSGVATAPIDPMELGKHATLTTPRAGATPEQTAILGELAPTHTESMYVADTLSTTYQHDSLPSTDEYYVTKPVPVQDLRMAWDPRGPNSKLAASDTRNYGASVKTHAWSDPDPANAMSDAQKLKRYRDAKHAVFGKRETEVYHKRIRLGGNQVYQKKDSVQTDHMGRPRFARGYKHNFANSGYTYHGSLAIGGGSAAGDKETAANGAVNGAIMNKNRPRGRGAGYNLRSSGTIAESLHPGGFSQFPPAPPYPRSYSPNFAARGTDLAAKVGMRAWLLFMQTTLSGLSGDVCPTGCAMNPLTNVTLTKSQWEELFVETLLQLQTHGYVEDANGQSVDYRAALSGCRYDHPTNPEMSYSGCWRRSDNDWPYFQSNPQTGRNYRTAVTGQRRYRCDPAFDISEQVYASVSDWRVFTDTNRWVQFCSNATCPATLQAGAPCQRADEWIDYDDWASHDGPYERVDRTQQR